MRKKTVVLPMFTRRDGTRYRESEGAESERRMWVSGVIASGGW